jgi:hypothetical protein
MEDQARRYGINADVTLDEQGGVNQVSVDGVGGAKAGQNLDLPAGFPEDVPLGNGWNIVGVSPAPLGGFMIQAMTTGAIAEVAAGTSGRLIAAGWTQTAATQLTPQMIQLDFEKGSRIANVNLIDAGQQITVQLATMQKP